MWFVLEITTDSNNQRNSFQCTGLIRVALEKLKVCLRSNMWEKRTFQSSFNLIDRLCSLILFLNCVGFSRCNVCYNLCTK